MIIISINSENNLESKNDKFLKITINKILNIFELGQIREGAKSLNCSTAFNQKENKKV